VAFVSTKVSVDWLSCLKGEGSHVHLPRVILANRCRYKTEEEDAYKQNQFWDPVCRAWQRIDHAATL
jgi:hypothetical protein